ncbi:hypothetical protein PFICI_06857 [Pestalotiopsis fici W106-1]|uniref:Rhodopsin domain-containing protein n=1 Tax=Pestalotiopsis fici (strain W106-1 / CGMCC3.15140) TaxID=1229662 RepID=W3X727_PESFW|nr:uncharacterized protein PFICI_06857 [Pestalotiopsis fici W106-1]ETS81855.1 hypothetical protein PFICI_06857 [Pestalotiopsis fici W106-1]
MGIVGRQDATSSTTPAANYASIQAVVACTIVMSILSTFMVGARMAIRWSRTHLDLEDWFIIACMPFMYAIAAAALIAVYRGGLGYSVMYLYLKDQNIIVISMQCLMAMEVLYAILITLVKLSVLVMYRRVFPTTLVLRGTYVLGALSVAWWIAVILVTFLQCTPLNGMWELFTVKTTCMDKLGLFIGNAIPNLSIDVLIIALPLYEVARLQMARVKKIGILSIFLLGGVTVVIGGLRLSSGLDLLSDPNSDYTLMVGPLWAWTVVEPAMGIVCACLPTVGGPIVGMIVKTITTSKHSEPLESTRKNKRSSKVIHIVGGSSSRGINRAAFSSKSKSGESSAGSFERLNDSGGETSPTNLWPKGYRGDRDVTVSGRRASGERTEDIPLTSITVRQEMSWTESKAAVEYETT